MKRILFLIVMSVLVASLCFATTYTLTSEEIKQRGFISISEALASLPGIDALDYYGNSAMVTVSINGSKGSQVEVYVDGVRQSRDYDGSFNLGLLSIHNIDKIEVTGSEGIGGRIWIYTKSNGEVSVYNRSLLDSSPASASDHVFASQDVSASYKFNINDNNAVKASVSFSHDSTAHRQTEEYNKLPVYNLDSILNYSFTSDKLDASFNFHYSYNDADTIGSSTWVSYTNTKTQNLDVSATGKYRLGESDISVAIGYKNKKYDYKPYVSSEWDPNTLTKTGDFSFSATYAGHFDTLNYSAELMGDAISVNSTCGIDKSRFALGLKLYALYSLDNFDFSLDAKVPFTKSTDTNIIGTIVWKADKNTETNVSVSGGFSTQVPNMSALYWPVDYTMFYQGNPDLKTEKGWNLDVGISSKPIKGLSYAGSVFLRRTYDLLAYVTDPITWMGSNANIDEALFIGSDQSLSAVLYDHIKFEAVATINYTYNLSGDNSIADKIRVNNVRMHTLKLVGGYISEVFDVLADAQFLGGYYYNNTKQSSTTLLGCTINYRPIDSLTLTVKGTNLLNQEYFLYEGYPMPGASVTVGVSFKF